MVGGCGRGQQEVTRVAQAQPATIRAAIAKPPGAGWFIPTATPGSSSAGSSLAAGLRTLDSTAATASTVRATTAPRCHRPRTDPSHSRPQTPARPVPSAPASWAGAGRPATPPEAWQSRTPCPAHVDSQQDHAARYGAQEPSPRLGPVPGDPDPASHCVTPARGRWRALLRPDQPTAGAGRLWLRRR
jgi:hypothetical protein